MKKPPAHKSLEKREYNGDASLLLDVALLRPLVAFPFHSRPISDHLHSLGYGWYLLVGSRDCANDDLPKETLRACMLVWASDLAGALLATRCDDTVSQVATESPNPVPPAKLLVPAQGWSYGELVRGGKGMAMETATYGNDGKYKFKKLCFPNVDVYFQSRRRKIAELPFAISIR